jgi:truncated hemoglobin YjbI
MKQRITEGQLSKLTDEQKERLIEWYQSIEDYTRTPLLSIGQMIQFIQEKKPQLKGISKNRFDKWFVNLDTGMLGYKDELCDALWEAVRQILKESAV